MTQAHDYKAVIDVFKEYQHLMHESGLPILNKNCFDAIEHALAMMQKLQEPSEGMVDAGINAWRKSEFAIVTILKAMLEQAEKEIGG